MKYSTKTCSKLAHRFVMKSIFYERISIFFAKLYLQIYSYTDNQYGQYLFTIHALTRGYTLSSDRQVLRFTQRFLDTEKPYSLLVPYYCLVYKQFFSRTRMDMKFWPKATSLQKSLRDVGLCLLH